MESYFEIGDVVILNSEATKDDPLYMTIKKSFEQEDSEWVTCQWFVDGYTQEESFSIMMVQIVFDVESLTKSFEKTLENT